MKHLIILAGGLAAAGQPLCAQGSDTSDLLQISGEALATYGNTHYSDSDYFAGLTLKANGQIDLGEARLTYRGELLLRSDHDDLPPDIDDIGNIEVALDMNAFGTFGYSTYNRCTGMGFPWTDGDVGNLGSVNIHPWVAATWRCAGGSDVIVAAGTVIDSNDYFFYHNSVGAVTVDLWWDPDKDYGSYSGANALTINGDEPPSFEGLISWDAGPVVLRAGGTNLGDRTAGLDVPLLDHSLTVSYDYQFLNSKPSAAVGQIFGALWQPEGMGPFRSARITYYLVRPEDDASTHNYIIDIRFGGPKWELGLGADGQGDLAAEGSYHLSKSLSLVAGWDNGFDAGDGWSGAYSPATSVPARGNSYEVGLKYTF
ncbi:hypothetical protein KM176_23360 [Pseudooceanicola sp. CBS1P-1]|uniref:Porin n=1 Tax=Pseudooceanicola albus TaxID=2692189 RepID=A0A6L7GCI2_9RHOB|nr:MULTISPECIES: hypothetical protein [Pseudooceanicola]MBT9386802.1 hypothetical protein [Pseudooceanicola endophyticus]MXN20940.1 hypothetical protein [Pseudooceanicola albus]